MMAASLNYSDLLPKAHHPSDFRRSPKTLYNYYPPSVTTHITAYHLRSNLAKLPPDAIACHARPSTPLSPYLAHQPSTKASPSTSKSCDDDDHLFPSTSTTSGCKRHILLKQVVP